MFTVASLSHLRKIAVGAAGISFYSFLSSPPLRVDCLSPRSTSQRVAVGYKCVDDYVKSNMIVGLGGGTTVQFAMSRIGQKVNSGELNDVTVIPCSEFIRKQCEALGIPTIPFSEMQYVDVAIDGIDEVDCALNVVKGSSGSFMREKRMHKVSNSVIFVSDDRKLTKYLGPGCPLPVEVITHAEHDVLPAIESLPSTQHARPIFRRGQVNNIWIDGFEKAVTENGNHIIDLFFDRPIEDPKKLAEELESLPGVLGHGLVLYEPKHKLLVASDRNIRIAGSDGESVWWQDKPTRQPLDRERVDNVLTSL
jgi:ribose 5-phosphate isomerase A